MGTKFRTFTQDLVLCSKNTPSTQKSKQTGVQAHHVSRTKRHTPHAPSSANVCDPGAPRIVPRFPVGTAVRDACHPVSDQQARWGASVARLLPSSNSTQVADCCPQRPRAAAQSSHLTHTPEPFERAKRTLSHSLAIDFGFL
jgi:hypothetical protein